MLRQFLVRDIYLIYVAIVGEFNISKSLTYWIPSILFFNTRYDQSCRELKQRIFMQRWIQNR